MLRGWKPMTGLKRGDVVLVLFPNSDLKAFKHRPALVVQADNLHSGLSQVIIAMITSNLQRRGHPSRVFVPLGSPAAKPAGLRTDSVIMADNLATVLEKAVSKRIGRFEAMASVDTALRHTLGL
jgi:mRNA interferase MazF